MSTPLASLRRRLSATVIVVSLVWGVVLALAVTYTVRQAVEELLDNALQESAEILYGLIRNHVQTLPVTAGEALPAPPHDEHLVWQVVSAQGEVRWRSHRAPQTALVMPVQAGLANADGGWRVYGMDLVAQGEMLYVAQVAHVRQAMRWRAAGASAAVTLLVGAMSAWWLRRRMNRELQPLAQLSAAVTKYDPLVSTAQGQPLPTTVQELEPMRLAIEDLGARLAHRVASERAFAAHAAHALRTPLAGMMAQLAVAQVKSSDEALPHLQRMGAALDRLRSVVAALLTLFRAEQAEPRLQRLSLTELARHLPFDNLRIDIAANGAQDSRFWGDADLLLAALLNLLDNAQRHGATAVALTLTPHDPPDGAWTLDISDNGRGLDAEACAALQAKLDAQTYAQLGGLGLMLSDLIARAHGGRLHLQHQPQGLRVSLWCGGKQDAAAQP